MGTQRGIAGACLGLCNTSVRRLVCGSLCCRSFRVLIESRVRCLDVDEAQVSVHLSSSVFLFIEMSPFDKDP